MQARSRSEDFTAKVATVPDVPGKGRGASADSATSGGALASDFRQPLMHDDDDARSTLVRSKILFDSTGRPPAQGRPASGMYTRPQAV